MDNPEFFAPIRIDRPRADGDHGGGGVETAAPAGAVVDWSEPIMEAPAALSCDRGLLSPMSDDGYKMLPLRQVLDVLGIVPETGSPKLDDASLAELHRGLASLGLGLACSISGPLRLRVDDTVGIVPLMSPRVPTRSVLTQCMYLLAWVAQADGTVSASDMQLIDRWIADFDPKAPYIPAARATMRWLADRKLVLTRKRKIRTARIARMVNRRSQLQHILLQLAADAHGASARRMERISTVYQLIGLDPADIHSDIHRLATSATVARRAAAKRVDTVIESSRLRDIAQSTVMAQKILADVFAEPDESLPEKKKPKRDLTRELLAALAAKSEWPRTELSAICADYGMTPGAAMERLNDLAYDTCDEPVIDDDEGCPTITIDQDIARQCLGD